MRLGELLPGKRVLAWGGEEGKKERADKEMRSVKQWTNEGVQAGKGWKRDVSMRRRGEKRDLT